MTTSLNLNNLQPLLAFPFRQPNANRKLLIGSLLGMANYVIPVVPLLLVMGYQKRLERHAIQTGELVLPEWDDWSALLIDGLKVFGASLIYMLPGVLAIIVGVSGLVASPIAAAIIEEGGGDQSLLTVPLAIGTLGGFVLFGLGLMLILVVSLFVQVALAHLIATDDFAAAFRFREWLPILRANLAGFVLAHLLLFGIGMVVSLVIQLLSATIVLCCLLPFVFGAYLMYLQVISGALFGLAYREGVAKLAVPPAPPAPALPA
jgi:hypothetical protein